MPKAAAADHAARRVGHVARTVDPNAGAIAAAVGGENGSLVDRRAASLVTWDWPICTPIHLDPMVRRLHWSATPPPAGSTPADANAVSDAENISRSGCPLCCGRILRGWSP